jgi:SsrA-binding protein
MSLLSGLHRKSSGTKKQGLIRSIGATDRRHQDLFGELCHTVSAAMTRCTIALSTLLLLVLHLLCCDGFVRECQRCSGGTVLWAKSGKKKKKPKDNTITVNRVAYRNYEILDTLEAGISLLGTEVKSIREGKMNIRDGFVRPSKDGRSCLLYNVHISKYERTGAFFQHEERRPRPLLIHKEQARRLLKETEQQGMTVVPLKAYFNQQNRVKIEIGLARGKNVRDKRQTIKDREGKREERRIIKNFRL